MDLRIVNTCNNDCMYCLEQSLRNKKKFISKNYIFDLLKKENDKKVLTFYWWNPLLHPDLLEIIKYANSIWFKNIWILTNSFWLDKYDLNEIKEYWLKSFWIYFNTFDFKKHDLLVWKNWIKLNDLLNNIFKIKQKGFFIKIIIHVNKQNIDKLYRDIVILHKKYKISNFEFVNYFPFDRPYTKFKKNLEYNISKNRKYINKLFKVINIFKLNTTFLKFPKFFFWDYYKWFYNFKIGILNQIWKEDLIKIRWNNLSFCKLDNRCENCFLQDICKWYGI